MSVQRSYETDAHGNVVLTTPRLSAGANVQLDEDEANGVTIGVPSVQVDTQEQLTVAGGASQDVSAAINSSFVTVTGSTGAATGSLANGAADGFRKTISLSSGTGPYIFTVSSCLSEYDGSVGPYAITLPQAGTSVTLQWNATVGAWTKTAMSLPQQRGPAVVVALGDGPTAILSGTFGSQSGTTISIGGSTKFTPAIVSDPPTYFAWAPMRINTGTASQSGQTVTGYGTSWNANVVGGQMTFGQFGIATNGTSQTTANITAFSAGPPQTLTVDVTATVTQQVYEINRYPFMVPITGYVNSTTVTTSAAFAQAVPVANGVNWTVYPPRPMRAIDYDGAVLAAGWNVADTSSDNSCYSILAAALARAAGGTLEIRDGTYFLDGTLKPGASTSIVCSNNAIFVGTASNVHFMFYQPRCQLVGGYHTWMSGFSHSGLVRGDGRNYGSNSATGTNGANSTCIRNVSVNGIFGVGGGNGINVIYDGLMITAARGGIQFGGTSSRCIVSNCTFTDCADDCISFIGSSSTPVQHCIAANNTVDGESHGVFMEFCDNCVVTGCSFSNILDAQGVSAVNADRCTVSGNSFDRCYTRVGDVGSLRVASGMDAYSEGAIGGYFTNSTIASNVFSNCGRAIVIASGQTGNRISGNVYINNTYPSLIAQGNIVDDTDETREVGDALVTRATFSTWQANVLGQQFVGHQLTTGPWSQAPTNEPFFSLYQTTQSPYGALLESVTMAVAYTDSSALDGAYLEVWTSDYTGANKTSPAPIYSGTITIPSMPSDVITPTNFVLTTPLMIDTTRSYRVNVRGPTDTEMLTAQYVTGRPTAYYHIAYFRAFVPTCFMAAGDLSSLAQYNPSLVPTGRGQLALGPSGTPLSQIKMYNATGTWPNPVPANSEVVIGPVTATGAVPTDQIFASTTGALPTGLIVGGAYCNANDQITFKVLNVTTTAYTGAASYSLWFQGISQ